MRILLATYYLAKTGGTENYTYALAQELLRRGHKVEYYAEVRGETSKKFERMGVPNMKHVYYDLILANHVPVVEKVCKKGFTVQTCHGAIAELEQPSASAHAHVVISEEMKEYLASKGFEARLIRNGVNCERFKPITPPNSTLKKVLSLCQSDAANNFLSRCCAKAGVEFCALNKFTDNVWAVEKYINDADLVVGIGRSAYVSMACGRCVISYDNRSNNDLGVGDGYLTKDNILRSIRHNCIGRGTGKSFTEDDFVKELQKYNPADGAFLRRFAEQNFNIVRSVDQYLSFATQPDRFIRKFNFWRRRIAAIIHARIHNTLHKHTKIIIE